MSERAKTFWAKIHQFQIPNIFRERAHATSDGQKLTKKF